MGIFGYPFSTYIYFGTCATIICVLNSVQSCTTGYEFQNSHKKLFVTCNINSYTNTATWSIVNVGQKTSCVSGGFCDNVFDGNYTFKSDINGIYISIDPYTNDDIDVTWKCEHLTTSDVCQIRTPAYPTSGNGGNDDDNCNVLLIIVVFFGVSFIVMMITFMVVLLLSCKFPNIGKFAIIVAFLVVDVVTEIIILWGIEYGSNYIFFQSDSECPVVLIGVVCHMVTLLIEVVKGVVLYRYMNRLKNHLFGTWISPESTPTGKELKDVVDRKAPEDVMILMHFTLPEGYSVDSWATEDVSSINDTSKYRPSDRGSLCIKAATKTDNGIYQSILKSNDSEQRINAVLHVTERKSVSLIIHPLIWRRLSSKKLNKITELKDVRHKLSTKKIDAIEVKKEDKSNVSIKSVRWKHNGRGLPSNYNNDDQEVPPLEVIKKDPIDEYHCTVEFSNKKSHIYIFIVKFTGARSGKNEDVIGVPTIMNIKGADIIPGLPPIRHTGTTAPANQNPESSPIQGSDLHPVTARSTTEDNT